MLSMNEIFILSNMRSVVEDFAEETKSDKQKVSKSAALIAMHKYDVETIKHDYLPYIRVQ